MTSDLSPPHAQSASQHVTDVLIIGAGPAGLWAAFELGLLQCSAHIVDALPMAGGQVAQLYGDKLIHDIPGSAACTGLALVQRLQRQLKPFGVPMSLGQIVQGLQRDDEHWLLRSTDGTAWRCRTVLIAAGVGAFAPRKLRGLDFALQEGRSVHYHLNEMDLEGKHCAVYGGGEQALASAVHLAQRSSQVVSLIYRRDVLQATASTQAAFEALRAQGRIRVLTGMIGGFLARGPQLMALDLNHANATSSRLQVDHLWIMEGLSNQLGAIADWGLAMARKQLTVDATTMATSEAGIYAVGDVVAYPNKRRLIVSAFHESTQAAYAIAEQLHPQGLGPQEYTSSSLRLQKKLGQA